MGGRWAVVRLVAGLLAGGALLAWGAVPLAAASGICPDGAAVCLVVNSAADTNVRDGVLTLREAVAVANGELPWATMSVAERGQVVLGLPQAPTSDGAVYVLFDAGVFGAASTAVHLEAAGLQLVAAPGAQIPARIPIRAGGRAAGRAGSIAPAPLSPPVLGQGPGPGVVLGGAIDPVSGVATNVRVTIDGGLLPAEAACVQLDRADSWLRGITFRGCPVALAIRENVYASTIVGSNGDGVDEAAEQVWFDSVGRAVLVN